MREGDCMLIERKWAMPNSKTFKIKPIKELIQDELIEGTIIDPFANEGSVRHLMTNKHIYITNDLDPYYDTDFRLDALDFLKVFKDQEVDMVLYDPPYSPRQVSEVYKKMDRVVNTQTTQSSYWGNQKKEIARVVKIGGKVITFGWNSGGIGKSNGFRIDRILIVPHGG